MKTKLIGVSLITFLLLFSCRGTQGQPSSNGDEAPAASSAEGNLDFAGDSAQAPKSMEECQEMMDSTKKNYLELYQEKSKLLAANNEKLTKLLSDNNLDTKLMNISSTANSVASFDFENEFVQIFDVEENKIIRNFTDIVEGKIYKKVTSTISPNDGGIEKEDLVDTDSQSNEIPGSTVEYLIAGKSYIPEFCGSDPKELIKVGDLQKDLPKYALNKSTGKIVSLKWNIKDNIQETISTCLIDSGIRCALYMYPRQIIYTLTEAHYKDFTKTTAAKVDLDLEQSVHVIHQEILKETDEN